MDIHKPRIIQNIFRAFYSTEKFNHLPLKDIKAADAIMNCRTPERGYNYLRCPDGHEHVLQTHSCRHRSCPLCAERARHQWVEAQQSRLLNCAHFHVIFTLPHEYLALWQYNQAWFTQAFFQVCRNTLFELLGDDRYLGATPGVLMTLHTWGRQLNLHPHLHCLVTAGGVNIENKWVDLKDNYLLPIRVVKALFRGKLQSTIKTALYDGELQLPPDTTAAQLRVMHRELYAKEWSVRIQDKYDHGRGVVLYLARYMKGSPLHPAQITGFNQGIQFRYKDHRDQRIKQLSLQIPEFIRRLLMHVPAPGIHVVRHYGLYAGKCRALRNQCRQLLGGMLEDETSIDPVPKDTLDWCCHQCGAALHRVYTTYQGRENENSFIKHLRQVFVQQGVQVRLAEGFFETKPPPN